MTLISCLDYGKGYVQCSHTPVSYTHLRFPVHEVHNPAEVARFAQVLPVIVGEFVFLVLI